MPRLGRGNLCDCVRECGAQHTFVKEQRRHFMCFSRGKVQRAITNFKKKVETLLKPHAPKRYYFTAFPTQSKRFRLSRCERRSRTKVFRNHDRRQITACSHNYNAKLRPHQHHARDKSHFSPQSHRNKWVLEWLPPSARAENFERSQHALLQKCNFKVLLYLPVN